MVEFISEPIRPLGSSDVAAMARGEPGLPEAFLWRERAFAIVARLDQWKQSGPEVGRLHGERYLRRHCYRLRMSDGAQWTVYFVRQTPKGRSAATRWYLLGVEPPETT